MKDAARNLAESAERRTYIMKYAEENIINNSKTLQEVVSEILNITSKDGLLSISSVKYGLGCLAMPREQEIVACFNRYRNLKL